MNNLNFQQQISREKLDRLKKKLKISDVLCQLLINRGIETYSQAKEFFRPQLSMLHDPFLIKDMEKAINKINNIIKENKKIRIYGDYDVDGTTSVSMLYDFFLNQKVNCDYYVNDREKEGYGMSFLGIDDAIKKNVNLIITIDCGTSSHKVIEYAYKRNIEVIICDHHEPSHILPKAFALLNNKLSTSNYPFSELCACAVGFKLIHGFVLKNNLDEKIAASYLDYVSIATISDIVPIEKENRVLAKLGLDIINNGKSVFSYFMGKNHSKKITSSDILFQIAPKINSAGRMAHAKIAIDLILTRNSNDFKKKLEFLESLNNKRKIEQDKTLREARTLIDHNKKSIIIFRESWNKGLIGIIASRLLEEFSKPTIVFTKYNNKYFGSARSMKGVNIYNELKKCKELIFQFGGHEFAAGLVIEENKFLNFVKLFESQLYINSDSLYSNLFLFESEIDFGQITPSFMKILFQFEPYGPHNPEPVFKSNNVFVQDLKYIGLNKEHVSLTLFQQNDPTLFFKGIIFKKAKLLKSINPLKSIDICYKIKENFWRDVKSIKLEIVDLNQNN